MKTAVWMVQESQPFGKDGDPTLPMESEALPSAVGAMLANEEEEVKRALFPEDAAAAVKNGTPAEPPKAHAPFVEIVWCLNLFHRICSQTRVTSKLCMDYSSTFLVVQEANYSSGVFGHFASPAQQLARCLLAENN